MAESVVKSYTIDLDLEQSDKTKSTIMALEQSLKDSTKSIESINQQFRELTAEQADASKEAAAYNKLLDKKYKTLEQENQKILYSMSEQGQKDIERLKALEAQTQRTRSEENELKNLRKIVINTSQAELKAMQAANREERKKVKMAQLEIKNESKIKEIRKGVAGYLKDDLKLIGQRIKKQFEFIKALKTTEGRYKALKKVGGTVMKAGGKAAAVGALGAVGIAAGAVGAAVGGAQTIADREKEANRIKANLSKEDKLKLVSDLYIRSGGDAASIVDAINRASTVLKGGSYDELLSAASAELEYPGASALFASQSKDTSAQDYVKLQNRLKAIQSVTGSSVSDLSEISSTVSNLRDSYFRSGASQSDILALYSALQGSGAYDSSESIERALRSFLGSVKSGENIYEKAQSFDWSKFVYGQQNKNQAMTAIAGTDWGRLKEAATVSGTTVEKSAAQTAAEKMRMLEEKKNAIVMKILDKISPMLSNGKLEKIIDNLLHMLDAVLPIIEVVFKALEPVIDTFVKLIEWLSKNLASLFQKIEKWLNPEETAGREKVKGASEAVAESVRESSMGGVVYSRSIVGERTPELVIPLDFARAGRSMNIVNNVSQSFNMQGNQTTAASLSQAVRQRSFMDSLISRRMEI